MTDTVQTALIASAAPTILALASLISSLRNSGKADANSKKIEEVHGLVNSGMNKLLKTTEQKSFAEGVKSETDKK